LTPNPANPLTHAPPRPSPSHSPSPGPGLFYFDASYRPVPLEMQFVGVSEKNYLARQNVTNEVCYNKARWGPRGREGGGGGERWGLGGPGGGTGRLLPRCFPALMVRSSIPPPASPSSPPQPHGSTTRPVPLGSARSRTPGCVLISHPTPTPTPIPTAPWPIPLLAQMVESLKQGYQVMVFVHSRKDTGKTARVLADLAAKSGDGGLLDTREHEKYGLFAKDVRKSRCARAAGVAGRCRVSS
jgi:hypothetical protein